MKMRYKQSESHILSAERLMLIAVLSFCNVSTHLMRVMYCLCDVVNEASL